MNTNKAPNWFQTHNVLTGAFIMGAGALVFVIALTSEAGFALIVSVVMFVMGVIIALSGRRLRERGK